MTGPGCDPYKVLQIDPEADDEIIQVVYRRLARKYHPDVAPGPEAAAKMLELNAAMEILGDPLRRRDYDRERARAAAPRPTGGQSRTPSWAVVRIGAGPRAESRPEWRRHPAPPRPQTVSRDWTSGRSTMGGGYDPARCARPTATERRGRRPAARPARCSTSAATPAGRSARSPARDLEYLEWLDRMAIGRAYRDEVDGLLRQAGRRRSGQVEDERGGCSAGAEAAWPTLGQQGSCPGLARYARLVAHQPDSGGPHHSARICRMLMLWSTPSPNARLISDAPPWVTNGSGMPVMGITPMTMPDVDDELEQRSSTRPRRR